MRDATPLAQVLQKSNGKPTKYFPFFKTAYRALITRRAISYLFFISIFVFFSSVAMAFQAETNWDNKMKNADKFDYRYFERLPPASVIPEAEASIRKHFPPGSDPLEFKAYFTRSGAKCENIIEHHFDREDSVIYCRRDRPWWIWTVVWVVVAHVDESNKSIIRTGANRYSDGL